jgi:hypothetical protein
MEIPMKHQRRPGALALGALFAAGTCYVLLGDARSPSELTSEHATAALVLAGTIAAGHLFGREAKSWRPLRAMGLALLFAAGTFYCVTSSAARNAEAPAARAAEAAASNEARKRLQADAAEARSEWARAKADAAKECSSGEGARCRGARSTASDAEARYSSATKALATAAPERRADAGLAHAARVFAAMPLVTADAAAIEVGLALLFPFAKACFMEVACIVFLGIGLGESVSTRVRDVSDGDEGVSMSREEALGDLRSLLAAGAVTDGRMLSRRWNVSETTASRWLSSWQRQGLVGRARDGRSRRPTAA